jgi:hypothetical protein
LEQSPPLVKVGIEISDKSGNDCPERWGTARVVVLKGEETTHKMSAKRILVQLVQETI